MATNLFRHREIHREMQRRIVGGLCPPGSRLPTRDELQVQFAASRHTVQKALEDLRRDGFISAHGKAGTFVTPMPPHLCTYGLVFPRYEPGTRFFRAVRHAAETVFNSEACRLRLYESESNNPTDPKNLRLLNDVTHHRLAGVILVWPTGEFIDSPLDAPDCDVPRVVFHGDSTREIPSILLDIPAFFERAVDRLLARGRRKIAHLGVGSDRRGDLNHLPPILKRRGLEYRPYWNQMLGSTCFTAAQAVTHLLMSLPPADRPDGLIISDDNLVGTRPGRASWAPVLNIPQDLEVVAHCTAGPIRSAAIFPLTRLGFDTVGAMPEPAPAGSTRCAVDKTVPGAQPSGSIPCLKKNCPPNPTRGPRKNPSPKRHFVESLSS